MSNRKPRRINGIKTLLLVEGIGIGVMIMLVASIVVFDHSLVISPRFLLSSTNPSPVMPSIPANVTIATDISISPSPTQLISIETPTIAPPIGRIVFTCTRGGYNQICIMDANGGNLKRLTDQPANDYYASLSRDGQFIVFASNRTDQFNIFIMNSDGSSVRQLTNGMYDVSAPEISPDGEKIVFASRQDGTASLWLMNMDGSDLHPLTGAACNEIDPTWSADGKQIAFASDCSGTVQLSIMNVDGSNSQLVTHDVRLLGGRNSWSPDGKSLVFYAGPKTDRDIYVVDIATGNVARLTQGGNNTGPCFSPDGRWIAFSSSREGNHEIYIMRTDGSQLTRLTQDPEDDWQPRWGP